MEISNREKAAFIIGMVRAFESSNWPSHFSKDDKSHWRNCYMLASQCFSGGYFNPLHAYQVNALYDLEIQEEI